MGGNAAMAAEKAKAVIGQMIGVNKGSLRKQFRFTRCGEYRIRYCQKYELGCGYRLVFIRKGNHIIFLYVGSHDDCFRWIKRKRGLTYKTDDAICDRQFKQEPYEESGFNLCQVEEDPNLDEYEAQLMRRLDDKTLRKIFAGFFEKVRTNDNS